MNTMQHENPARSRSSAPAYVLMGIAVLTLLAILAGVPDTGEAGRALNRAGATVAGALEQARLLAGSTRQPHGVVFDVQGNRIAVIQQDGRATHDPQSGATQVFELGVPGGMQVDLLGVDFGAFGTSAIFDGQAVPLAGGTIVLQADTVRRTFVVDPATGYLRTL